MATTSRQQPDSHATPTPGDAVTQFDGARSAPCAGAATEPDPPCQRAGLSSVSETDQTQRHAPVKALTAIAAALSVTVGWFLVAIMLARRRNAAVVRRDAAGA